MGKVILVTGAQGVGKTAVIKTLKQTEQYSHFIYSNDDSFSNILDLIKTDRFAFVESNVLTFEFVRTAVYLFREPFAQFTEKIKLWEMDNLLGMTVNSRINFTWWEKDKRPFSRAEANESAQLMSNITQKLSPYTSVEELFDLLPNPKGSKYLFTVGISRKYRGDAIGASPRYFTKIATKRYFFSNDLRECLYKAIIWALKKNLLFIKDNKIINS